MTGIPPNFDPLRFCTPRPSASERHAMIALAAYLRAERRGFIPGHEIEDWAAAEREIEQRLLSF